MRVACLGGGPAGLYFAISMKLRDPAHDIVVVERNRAGDTFGWGVVFSDQTLDNLRANDPESAAAIAAEFAHWDDIEVVVGDHVERSGGHGFIGIGRKRLLNVLQDRARALGVRLEFETEFDEDLSRWAGYDLIVAADGINSRIRSAYADRFGVDIETRANKFVWLGTPHRFDAFAFLFEQTGHGWIWAHAYRFEDGCSTFIVECSEATWAGLGFDRMDQAETVAACERIFARHLGGAPLLTNLGHLRGSAAWINFRRVLCDQWSFDNVVLLGDAAHTAHFSIGSGTKLALEDAIKLAEVMSRPGVAADRARLNAALGEYQAERHTEVLKIQNSARNSTEWFETLDRYIGFAPKQFAYSLLTRSQRVSHENLRLRDRAWLSGIERWFAEQAGAEANDEPPPMFAPYLLNGLRLANRVVVSPVLTYAAATDATPTDFHQVHYGARALGGAGLIVTEMTAVAADGRITPACPGLYDDAHIAAWRRIATFVHANSAAKLCVQLGHAGARGATEPGFTAPDRPLANGGWPLLAASALPYKPGSQTPAAMTRAGMDDVRDAFARAAERADAAGFDMIELQAGHGFLLSSFITPVLNRRDDDYGGSLENRLRFPLEILAAVRAAWGPDRPIAVRISANDWVGESGVTPAEAVRIACALRDGGADLIDVSAGETAPGARPVYGRMFQTPLSDRIRNEGGCATMAVGNIFEPDHVNSILAAGRADLVALGRPHLADPAWTMRAAAAAGYRGLAIPPAYALGQAQLAWTLQQRTKPA
ncbi:bifunctional salicylyl-CoA 5-hydroxylase/oxidoreductase [Sphingomonas nostoxanthinifaciens]|uniref:bifunctional salicylyl-CoA 5-hydroxylase/oxidoreductase n=1 Tax=Sphingomonas nostoxanthinifaciens TaxID=2872652 RepID=UPI001CC1FAC4|nr:bifunctional salicylyl-CoA 5-hydroxylase/oxidoreductase [Sphingomonas nostoxanthinifaciens]UAK22903.1 bifunctional salicylyl-CoA 5-hydroxylase/oxidoreductase [Sphingomonas nostoxanthinifaciens]